MIISEYYMAYIMYEYFSRAGELFLFYIYFVARVN